MYHQFIIPDFNSYTFPNHCDTYAHYHQHAATSIYLSGKYSKSGKKELMATYKMKDMMENLLLDNPDTKTAYMQYSTGSFGIKAIAYTDPISGKTTSCWV